VALVPVRAPSIAKVNIDDPNMYYSQLSGTTVRFESVWDPQQQAIVSVGSGQNVASALDGYCIARSNTLGLSFSAIVCIPDVFQDGNTLAVGLDVRQQRDSRAENALPGRLPLFCRVQVSLARATMISLMDSATASSSRHTRSTARVADGRVRLPPTRTSPVLCSDSDVRRATISVAAVFLAALCGLDCKKSPPPADDDGGSGGNAGASGGAGGSTGDGGGSTGTGGGPAGAGGGGNAGAGGATGGSGGGGAICRAADHSYVATPAGGDAGSLCIFAIPDDPTGGSKDRIKVSVDGGTVSRDPARTDGWDYTDASLATLQLFGAACAAVTDGSAHTVCVTFLYLPP
jgi:hypothetical protein